MSYAEMMAKLTEAFKNHPDYADLLQKALPTLQPIIQNIYNTYNVHVS